MRRRLYDETWLCSAVVIGFLSLSSVLIFSFRIVALEFIYGIIPVEIPVVSTDIEKPGFHTFKETPHLLSKHTPTVVFTSNAFYFGDIESFTKNFTNDGNKFIVRHDQGQPQLTKLIDTMQQWVEYRSRFHNIPKQKSMILIPTSEIPIPIVAQTIAGLRTSPFFQRIILGTGIK